MKRQFIQLLSILVVILLTLSCKKKEEEETIPDNTAPYYSEVPTLLVNNYVNRLYIDLIGREPLDAEMAAEVSKLRNSDLSFESRDSLISRLQSDETFIDGDTSYKQAYYQRFYDLAKTRLLEGASDGVIGRERGMLLQRILADSLAGNLLGLQLSKEKLSKINNILDSKTAYQNGIIGVNEVFARLLDNEIYDEINMNTFNFVRASFNDLYLRFPTQEEFDIGFDMIENNNAVLLFGQSGQNKGDYIEIVVNSPEFYEGLIWWMYQNLLSRDPSTKEIHKYLSDFLMDGDLQKIQKEILKTDEYANFD